MSPTNEQIMAEVRRRTTAVWGKELEDTIIEVMREGWTPPEPVVDPDLLAFREWLAGHNPAPSKRILIDRGHYDNDSYARAYLAGARMAREQERERAKALEARVAELEERLKRFETMGHYPPTSTPGPWLLKESDL